MGNLLDSNKWAMTNTIKNGEEFTLVNGQMQQSIPSMGDETKYRLQFNCLSFTDLKSYFLIKVSALDGKHTYLVPINFLGESAIEVELVKDIRTLEIMLVGSLKVADIGFYENGMLTESQKVSLGKVESESDKWDRIVEVTNEQGNLIANRLEGDINNALNTIFGGNGTMEMIDGTIIFRDKKTDAESTMAMRLNYGGLAIANSKLPNGVWDWKTFGTGQGFTADYLNAGTLSAVTIDGVKITGTNITGGTITGAVFDGGTTQSGTINGATIKGSTMIAGETNRTTVTLDNTTTPFTVKYDGNKRVDVFATDRGGSEFGFYDYNFNKTTTLRGGSSANNGISVTNAQLELQARGDNSGDDSIKKGRIMLDASEGVFIFDRKTYDYSKSLFKTTTSDRSITIGNMGTITNIFGTCYIPELNPERRAFSTMQVENYELQYKLQKESIARSNLEVILMEKGVM